MINDTRAFVDKCRHFTGVLSRADGSRINLGSKERGQCKAGVYYDDVQKPGFQFPCFHPKLGQKQTTCDKCSWKTPDEIDAEVKLRNEQFEKSMKVFGLCRPAILKHAENKKGVSGKLKCPVCEGGELRYRIAGNGHVHAHCSTEGCASWME